jgi:hypothetical protein
MKTSRTLPAALVAALLILTTGGAPHGAAAADAPEISRSAGVEGGIVVLWPRIIPGAYRENSAADAAYVQRLLVQMAREAFPGRPIDVRPAPERVCGQAGCRGVTIGAVLLREGNGVSVLATVSQPGRSPARLIPWTGAVRLGASTIPFREPPESFVTVADFASVSSFEADLAANRAAIVAALRDAGR